MGQLRWAPLGQPAGGSQERAVCGPFEFIANGWVAACLVHGFEVWHRRFDHDICAAKDACEEQLAAWSRELWESDCEREPLLRVLGTHGVEVCQGERDALAMECLRRAAAEPCPETPPCSTGGMDGLDWCGSCSARWALALAEGLLMEAAEGA